MPSDLAPKWEQSAKGRYQYELRALEQVVGDTLLVDADALKEGVLILEFEWPLEDRAVPLRAIFPDSYPRFRPRVNLLSDPSEYPKRHCSPLDGNLCLLGRDSRQWRNGWTLRHLLECQLEDALSGGGDEDPQGEPAEYWWNSLGGNGSYCLINSSWTLGDATSGKLRLLYKADTANGVPHIRAIVTEVRNANDAAILTWDGPIPDEFSGGKGLTIPWTYLDEAPLPDREGRTLLELADRHNVQSNHPVSRKLLGRWTGAFIYKMETGFQSEGLGWLFPYVFGPKQSFQKAKRGKGQPSVNVCVIPTLRGGESDLGTRVPAVRLLREKRVAIIGLGAVGAPVALELAKNGCRELHVLDCDIVEPGNSIRWPVGASAWGQGKGDSLRDFIHREYPWCRVTPHAHAIGGFEDNKPECGDKSVLGRILPNVDLIVDGTASYGVSTILSDECRKLGIPFVSLYASPPVKGGVVIRFAPQSGCPTCLEIAHTAGLIERAPGFDDEDGLQQPPGCAERTFTGASFDLQELSLEAVRLVMDTLTHPDEAAETVVHTLSLWVDGRRVPPDWRVDPLPKQDGCSCRTTP